MPISSLGILSGRAARALNRTFVQALSGAAVPESAVGAAPPSRLDEPVWHLYSAVCLERLPVVAPSLSALECEFASLLHRREFERSLKSDHEMRHEMDVATAEALRVSEGDDPDLVEAASMQTAADFEDACTEELAGFRPAPTVTEADRTGDLRSLERELSTSLVLVVNQRLGTGASWMMPQLLHMRGETMRQTAERTLHTMVGSSIKARLLGNAPWGFYKYKYPRSLQRESGVAGGKVFFYKAALLGGLVEPTADEVTDYRWLTSDELQRQLSSSYYRSVRRLLISHD